MSPLLLVLATAYLSVALAYYVCARLLDGPWQKTEHLWLLGSVVLWPTIPLYLLARALGSRLTITRNTAKMAPAGTEAGSPEPASGSEQSVAGGGGSHENGGPPWPSY